jgi:TonB-linked SusC/RagA family outer membrane protein
MRSKFKWIFTLLVAFTMQFSFAQQKTVTGTVTSEGKALPGATVTIAGTQQGTQTDENGKFSIKAAQGDVLEVSYLGKDSKTAQIGAGNVVNVVLATTSETIEAVQIVGALGIKKRIDATTSTTQNIKNKELTQAANPNVIQSLAGKVSGLQINLSSNGVSGSSRVVLRGNRSITGNNQALVVIDNVISSLGILQQLAPEAIENVSVIKGQQGGALYGEQGSNGVILVTTKKGTKKGKMEVSLNSSVDFVDLNFLPKRQTQYGQGWRENAYDFSFADPADPRNPNSQYSPYENGAWGPSFSDPNWAGTMVPVGLPQADGSILFNKWESRGSDNIKDFFRKGSVYQNNITINAGSEDSYALLNIGRQQNEFVVEGDQSKKNTFLFKAGKKFNKFKIDGIAQYINQSVSQTDSNLLYELLQTPTNVDVNQFKNSGTLHHWTMYAQNPYQIIKQKRFDDNVNNFLGNIRLEYELTKNISLSYNGSLTLIGSKSTSHNDGFNGDFFVDYSPILDAPFSQGDFYSQLGGADQYEVSNFYVSTLQGRNYYGDLILNFDYDLTKDLNMKFNIGQNIQENYSTYTQQGGTGLEVDGWYHIKNVSRPDNPASLSNGYTLLRRFAGFGNVDLDYKGYLFLNATGRYERSSVLPKAFFYPSVGVSFVPTTAFESIKGNTLNYAKVYANYSKVGNTSSIPAYALTDIVNVASGFPFGDLYGFRPRSVGYATSSPEFMLTKEAGINLGFFKDRITFEGAVYQTDTDKLITTQTTSTASGLTGNQNNIGKLQNRGFEIDLGVNPIRSKSENGFNWNFRTGFTKYKTIVKSLSDGQTEIALSTGTGVGIYAVVGEEFPLIKATQLQTDADGHVIVGTTGIPLVTSTLQTVGKANPDFILNFSNNFSYKGFTLFAGYTLDSAEFDRTQGYLVPNSVVNTGTPSAPVYVTNTVAVTPSRYDSLYNSYAAAGERSIVDASALKIREIALAYSLPSKYLKNTGVTSLKFGVNARNPFVFFFANGHGMKNEGYTDPEASFTTSGNGQGISNVGQYPTTKTYGVSVNLTF